MKTTMVIPTYWGRKKESPHNPDDTVYDHPTPIDSEGTLQRAIESISVLDNKDFELIIIVATTTEDIEVEAEKKVKEIIKASASIARINISMFGPSQLKKISRYMTENNKIDYTELLSLDGYSNVRNMCLFIPHIISSDTIILIDDDEVFEDTKYIDKAKQFIHKKYEGKTIDAVAGYYLQENNDFRADITPKPWTRFWDKNQSMNSAFDKVIGTQPRLKKTSFVFGGNMILHKNIFKVIPFDPSIPRGEDIDYLINAKMFGFDFYLDNELSIKHLPPKKSHPIWNQIREDIYRFIYEKSKIENQRPIEGMAIVQPKDLGDYPGNFIDKNLEKKIEDTCNSLSDYYLSKNNIEDSKEALKNIMLAKTDAIPDYDTFKHLCRLQKTWQEMMLHIDDDNVRKELKNILKTSDLMNQNL
ncbi:MAG: hypothetical protein KAI18_02110 [Candidatus Aenigmarchaeota archaeon]|nr:hypothetical protein [Candidatus Aenigmarchaeota archaeon]